MKFSEKWLREWINPNIDSAELQHQLTMLGLAVDDVEPLPVLKNVVVASIESSRAHPNADELRICDVDDGSGQLLSVVCGAPNAQPGLRAPLARPGVRLPDGSCVKQTELHGVVSQGRLCSARELSLADDTAGLMELPSDAPIGSSIEEYLQTDDTVIEIQVTPNRGDCLSILGVAREVAARNRMPVQMPPISLVEASIADTFPVELTPGMGCTRYVGRVIKDIDPNALTPLWMAERLRRGGVRTISPVVDVTNYVMLELGQPMHGFDLDKLSDRIGVRDAKAGELIGLLDGRDVELDQDTLVIADARGAIAVAGIMGGEDTAVSECTRNIFFEAAVFHPQKIAGRPRRYNAHTESAHRFERAVDPLLQLTAIERATHLLIAIAGGKAGPVIDNIDESAVYAPVSLKLTRDKVGGMLGIALSDADIVDILSGLGLSLVECDEGWWVQVPSYRSDIGIEEDLVEEVARIYGYERIPRTQPILPPLMKAQVETEVSLGRLKLALVERGYREAVTYSFVDRMLQEQTNPDIATLSLANPISSDMAVMRTSLWPGLLSALQKNLNHKQSDIQLFEAGLTFIPGAGELLQHAVLAGLVSGHRQPEHWCGDYREADFFDVKGDIEALFHTANAANIRFETARHPALHPGQSARLYNGSEPIGWLGTLHPAVRASLSLSQSAIVFEIQQSALVGKKLAAFEEFSKYPAIRRDIAIVVNEDVTLDSILSCIDKYSPNYLRNVIIFDVYTGKGVILGRKSIALGLILQDLSRTLTDADIEATISEIVTVLNRDLDASLR